MVSPSVPIIDDSNKIKVRLVKVLERRIMKKGDRVLIVGLSK